MFAFIRLTSYRSLSDALKDVKDPCRDVSRNISLMRTSILMHWYEWITYSQTHTFAKTLLLKNLLLIQENVHVTLKYSEKKILNLLSVCSFFFFNPSTTSYSTLHGYIVDIQVVIIESTNLSLMLYMSKYKKYTI
jgi:hypothetical protein